MSGTVVLGWFVGWVGLLVWTEVDGPGGMFIWMLW